jgi:pyridoxal phosphate enzyme (YggS family)
MPVSSGGPDGEVRAEVLARLSEVRRRIDAAAEASGRRPEDVTLVTITKTFAAEAIAPVLEAGIKVFGENRVQEAAGKWPPLKQSWPGIELHLVGPLQTNKVAQAVALFDCIETLDRPKLAQALAAEFERQGRRPDLFVQVNTGAEPQKAGALPGDADRFIAECREAHGLAISGLMAIPPLDEEPAMHFALLEKIARRNGLAKLSMGMSGDFETAIALGATHVRLGTAIFGDRPHPGG